MLLETEEDLVTVESLTHLDRSTLRERTLEALRTAITSGQYRPGDHLREAEVATSLGVSRGTVRQALRHLQQEGLVSAGHRSMLRVNSFSAEEVRELFRVRAALEGLAASQISSSAERARAADSLRTALVRLVEAEADFTARVDADLDFHLLLCQLSKNSVLIDTWRHLEGRLRVVIMAAGPLRAQPSMSHERYNAIIDTIESGGPSAAVDAINQHMAVAADQLAVRTR
jgi:DNA-binding GntR family transcriptional regulator